jgi:hypothetical protein
VGWGPAHMIVSPASQSVGKQAGAGSLTWNATEVTGAAAPGRGAASSAALRGHEAAMHGVPASGPDERVKVVGAFCEVVWGSWSGLA